jgi:hypothetical protein
LLVALSAACTRRQEPLTARGLVVDMRAASFNQIATFELRRDDGQSLSFAVEGDVGITPGHLREHMVFAQPVTVTYRPENDLLIATRIDD